MQLSYRCYKQSIKRLIDGNSKNEETFLTEENAVKQHLGIDDDEIITYGHRGDSLDGLETMEIATKYAIIKGGDLVTFYRDGYAIFAMLWTRMKDVKSPVFLLSGTEKPNNPEYFRDAHPALVG